MQVLVFGKSGQVASELAKFDNVTCLSRTDADLMDPNACEQIIANTNADVIINAAAYTNVDGAEEDEVDATQINGTTVGAIAMAAAARNIPFLHISTDYVFEGMGDTFRTPKDKTNPTNSYGRGKLIGEQMVRAAKGQHAILRTSWVYAPHGQNFVKTMLRVGAMRDALNVVDDQIGGPTPAKDIAATLMVMAKAFVDGKGENGIYHFAGAPAASWADFARAIFHTAGMTTSVNGIPTTEYPTPATRPLNSRLDCRDLERVFGIKQPDWRADLNSTIPQIQEATS